MPRIRTSLLTLTFSSFHPCRYITPHTLLLWTGGSVVSNTSSAHATAFDDTGTAIIVDPVAPAFSYSASTFGVNATCRNVTFACFPPTATPSSCPFNITPIYTNSPRASASQYAGGALNATKEYGPKFVRVLPAQ